MITSLRVLSRQNRKAEETSQKYILQFGKIYFTIGNIFVLETTSSAEILMILITHRIGWVKAFAKFQATHWNVQTKWYEHIIFANVV